MKKNLFTRVSGRHAHGSCTAFLKADMPGCHFYEPGKDGWCKHTLKALKFEETIPPARPWLKPGKREKIFKDHVTGECYSEQAAAEAAKAAL